VDTIWTLPQLLWVKRQESELFSRTKKILFAKDYVRHRLTGDYVTDLIEAEGSMLFDMEKGCWSEELCAAAGVDPRILPTICAAIPALLLCYLCGTVQFLCLTDSTIPAALAVCVLPFLPFDMLKLACAVMLSARFRRHL
jgi:hypothetical protein